MEKEEQSSNPWVDLGRPHDSPHATASSIQSPTPAQDEPEDGDSPDIPAPPAYSSDQNLNRRSHLLNIAGQTELFQRIDTSGYIVEGATLSKDRTVMNIKNAELVSDPKKLKDFIMRQISLPPKPVVRFLGWHRDSNGSRQIDFDISINMMHLIVRPEGDRWDYVVHSQSLDSAATPAYTTDTKQVTGPSALDVTIRTFMRDTTAKKTFTIERKVINWDTGYIHAQVFSLLNRLNYKGETIINFPTQHSKVVVHSVKSEEAKKNAGFFDSLVDKVSFFPPKDYNAAQVVWPYASDPVDMDDGLGQRKCAVQNERSWWNSWKKSISNCILSRRIGWASVEDQLETQMGYAPAVPLGTYGSSGWGKSGDRTIPTQSEL